MSLPRGAKINGHDRSDLSHWPLTGPRNISSSDLDRILMFEGSINVSRVLHDEPSGQFLVVEHKRPGEPLPAGQERLLRGLAALDAFTVLVVVGAGDTDDPQITVTRIGANRSDDRALTALCRWSNLQTRVHRWFWLKKAAS